MPGRLTEAQAKLAGNLVGEAKTRDDLTNEKLAERAGYNERTVRDVISGKCHTYQTVKEVCSAVKVDLDAALSKAGLTDDDGAPSNVFGGYSKSNYRHLIGGYTTIRCAYADPANLIKCYRTMIHWDAGISALCFSETKRDDENRQDGQVYIPPGSAFMYLMTVKNGRVRTILISQLVQEQEAIMRGLILSQFNASGPHYAPICTPIVYLKEESEKPIDYGDIGANNPDYRRYRKLLDETLSLGFVKLAVPQMPQ